MKERKKQEYYKYNVKLPVTDSWKKNSCGSPNWFSLGLKYFMQIHILTNSKWQLEILNQDIWPT